MISLITWSAAFQLMAQDKVTPEVIVEAKGTGPIKGFFYDKDRDKYFSNTKSIFTIRPSTQTEYLDKIEVSIDGTEFKKYDGALSFTNEGPHQVRFRAVDPVLNWSPIQTFRIFVDQTAPKSQVVWKGPTFEEGKKTFVNPKTQLNILAQDNLSGIASINWKEKDNFTPFRQASTFEKEGEHSFQIKSLDNVGNEESAYELRFIVDRKSPETTTNIQGTQSKNEQVIFTTAGSQVALTSSDDKSGIQRIEYQINDGLVSTYKRPIVLSEAKTILKYRSIDNVDNKEEWKQMTIHQDSRPPRITLTKEGTHYTISGKIYALPGFSFVVRVNDEDSGTADRLVSFDGQKFNPSKENTFKFDAAGEYKFHFKAIDKVGNEEESNPFALQIDNVPPTITIKSTDKLVPHGEYFLSAVPNRLSFDTTDAGVGVEKVEYSYDGKKFEAMANPIELSKWTDSKRTIYYRAIDRLGNMSEIKTIQIVVTTDGPKVELFVESENLPNIPLSKIKK